MCFATSPRRSTGKFLTTRKGLPVDTFGRMKEGAGLSAGQAILTYVNQAPHPSAAKVFINWFLSRDGQMAVQEPQGNEPAYNSLRDDIPKDHLPPRAQRQKGVNYIRLWGPSVWDRSAITDLVSEMAK